MKKVMFASAAVLAIYSVLVMTVLQPARGAQISEVVEEVWKNSAQIGDMQRRLNGNETSSQTTQNKVDNLADRIAKLEGGLETGNRLHLGEIGGLLILLIEKALSIKKRLRSDG